jgi:hypothetical protein
MPFSDYKWMEKRLAELKEKNASLTEEVEKLRGFETLYKAGCDSWRPAFETILTERDTLRTRVAELEGVLVDIRDDEECSFSIACIVTKALGGGPKARAALSQPEKGEG